MNVMKNISSFDVRQTSIPAAVMVRPWVSPSSSSSSSSLSSVIWRVGTGLGTNPVYTRKNSSQQFSLFLSGKFECSPEWLPVKAFRKVQVHQEPLWAILSCYFGSCLHWGAKVKASDVRHPSSASKLLPIDNGSWRMESAIRWLLDHFDLVPI